MSKVVKGSFELMKKLNVEAILKVIKNNGSYLELILLN